jgi:hypothetical protein
MEHKDYTRYICQEWVKEKLQEYQKIKRLIDDKEYRERWILCESEDQDESFLREYLDQLRFNIVIKKNGRPTIHIQPKKYKGKHYGEILGIKTKHLSTALTGIIDSATRDVITGYGKGAVLTSIFGEEYGQKFNEYIVGKMKEEFGTE